MVPYFVCLPGICGAPMFCLCLFQGMSVAAFVLGDLHEFVGGKTVEKAWCNRWFSKWFWVRLGCAREVIGLFSERWNGPVVASSYRLAAQAGCGCATRVVLPPAGLDGLEGERTPRHPNVM